MITLFSFGRAFGLPDPSPFVCKAEVLLKMASLPYQMDTTGFNKAPKGKIPYIIDGDMKLGDSTFIRDYLEKKYKADFNKGLSAQDKAIGWAFEKMCEDHLYWALLDARWLVDENFNKGPAIFFQKIPGLVRPLIVKMIRGKVAKTVRAHGMGRHTRSEIEDLAKRDIAAISEFLGNKKYFMGDQVTGTDATIWAFITGALCPHFDTPMRRCAESYPNLRAYNERMMKQFFSDLASASGEFNNHRLKAMECCPG